MLQKLFNAIFFVVLIGNAKAQNVGIGTTTPNQKLDIDKGRLRFTGNPGAGISQGIEFTDPAGTTLNGFVGVYNDSITGMFGFLGSNWSFLHNNKNGNIGLQGNSNPRAPLSFASTTGNKIALWGNADAAHYGMGVQGAQMQLYTDVSSSDITFGYGKSSSFTENMRIKGNGNVGIGTATPSAKLDVNGGLQTSAGANFGDDVGISGDLQTQGSIATDASLFVSDNATINGIVKIAGGSPGVGKVLTSDAGGNASWQNGAYGNTERFMFNVTQNPSNNSHSFATVYNYGSTVASYYNSGGIEFFFGSPGLYHFDINTDASSSAGGTMRLYFRLGNATYLSTSFKKLAATEAYGSIDKSFEIYIPSSSYVYYWYLVWDGTGNTNLNVTGHKIAD